MTEPGGIQEIVNLATIQVVIAVMMVLQDTDVVPQLSPLSSLRESQRQGHGRLALEKPSFNWNVQDRYVELLNFRMEVMNILGTKYKNQLIKKRYQF